MTDALVPSPPAEVAPARPSFFRRHRLKIVPLALLLVVAGGAALWTLATLTFSYSSGDRIGYVQKLSRKGWVCRTWEGELAMSPVPGTTPWCIPHLSPRRLEGHPHRERRGHRPTRLSGTECPP